MFFARKTVDDVMSTFTKALADLSEVATQNQAEIVKQDQVIADAQAVKEAAEVEIGRATTIRSRLNALLGLDAVPA